MKTLTKNLRAVFKMASPETFKAGKSWYRDASIFAEDIANVAGVSKEIAVGVIAALSPQCSWPNNKQSAINLLYTGNATGYTGYKVNVAKARRIIAGESIPTVLGNGSRYGAKVRAFFDNIMNPASSELVTVDTHAIRAAYDLVDVPRDLIRAIFETKLNAEVQAAYVTVAKENNLRPCELQAIVWLVVKENL